MFRTYMLVSVLATSVAASSTETCHAIHSATGSTECAGHALTQGGIVGNSLLQTNSGRGQVVVRKTPVQLEGDNFPDLAQIGEDSSSSELSCATSEYENADFTHGQAGTCTGCLIPKNHGEGLPLCFYRNDKYAEVACSADEGKVWCGNHAPVTQAPSAATPAVASSTAAPEADSVAPQTTAPTTTTTTTISTTTTTTTTSTTQNPYECIAPPGKNFEMAKEICPKQNEYWCKIKGPSCEWKLRGEQASAGKENGACSSEKGTAWSDYCSKSEAKSNCESRYAGEGKCTWTPTSDTAPSEPAGGEAAASCEDDASFKNNWGWSCATLASASWAKSIRDAKCSVGWAKGFAEPCKKTCNRC